MPVRPSALALFVMPLLALACVGVAASDSPANPDTAAADELHVLNRESGTGYETKGQRRLFSG